MRRDIGYDVTGFDSATWVRPGSVNAQGQFVRDRMSHMNYREAKIQNMEEKREKKKEKQQKIKRHVRNLAGAHFSFFGMSLPFSLQPLAHEADERDHVGPFVSRFPISVCIPEEHDEAEHRSSSTKDGISCHF